MWPLVVIADLKRGRAPLRDGLIDQREIVAVTRHRSGVWRETGSRRCGFHGLAGRPAGPVRQGVSRPSNRAVHVIRSVGRYPRQQPVGVLEICAPRRLVPEARTARLDRHPPRSPCDRSRRSSTSTAQAHRRVRQMAGRRCANSNTSAPPVTTSGGRTDRWLSPRFKRERCPSMTTGRLRPLVRFLGQHSHRVGDCPGARRQVTRSGAAVGVDHRGGALGQTDLDWCRPQ